MAPDGPLRRVAVATAPPPSRGRRTIPKADPDDVECCGYLHEAVELIGKRWTGAIVFVLLQAGTMRFSQIGNAIPALSDRLLSERMKELEARGIVNRHVHQEAPVRVEYELTDMGLALAPVMAGLQDWARHWL
jgi:DNA-binding HxlR family transcriptional regulator